MVTSTSDIEVPEYTPIAWYSDIYHYKSQVNRFINNGIIPINDAKALEEVLTKYDKIGRRLDISVIDMVYDRYYIEHIIKIIRVLARHKNSFADVKNQHLTIMGPIIYKELIHSGLINVNDNEYLHHAIIHGYKDIVELLLEYGADPNSILVYSALEQAMDMIRLHSHSDLKNKYLDVVKVLIKWGAVCDIDKLNARLYRYKLKIDT